MFKLNIVAKIIKQRGGGNGGLAEEADNIMVSCAQHYINGHEPSIMNSAAAPVSSASPPNPPNPPNVNLAASPVLTALPPFPPFPPLGEVESDKFSARLSLLSGWPVLFSVKDFESLGIEPLNEDIKHLMRYLPSSSRRRLEALQKYINIWLNAMDAEPVGHKKQNKGRTPANLWLLRTYSSESHYDALH